MGERERGVKSAIAMAPPRALVFLLDTRLGLLLITAWLLLSASSPVSCSPLQCPENVFARAFLDLPREKLVRSRGNLISAFGTATDVICSSLDGPNCGAQGEDGSSLGELDLTVHKQHLAELSISETGQNDIVDLLLSALSGDVGGGNANQHDLNNAASIKEIVAGLLQDEGFVDMVTSTSEESEDGEEEEGVMEQQHSVGEEVKEHSDGVLLDAAAGDLNPGEDVEAEKSVEAAVKELMDAQREMLEKVPGDVGELINQAASEMNIDSEIISAFSDLSEQEMRELYKRSGLGSTFADDFERLLIFLKEPKKLPEMMTEETRLFMKKLEESPDDPAKQEELRRELEKAEREIRNALENMM